MAISSLTWLNFTPISSATATSGKNLLSFQPYFLSSSCLRYGNNKREFPLPSVASIPYGPINVDYLEQEFTGHGVTFEHLDDSCVAKMKLNNRSTATLMLPSGLITSYKAQMWHGGTTELLQTSVLEREDGSPVIQGGVYSAFNFETNGETAWSPSTWALHDVRGNSKDSIQIELICTDATDNNVEVKYIVHLREDTLSSELVVSNSKSSSIKILGCLISHLTVSTPEATYACGLEGSDFFSRPMFLSNYSIIPPDPGNENGTGSSGLWSILGLKGVFPGWGDNSDDTRGKQREREEEMEGEETESSKQLTQEMSRIYTSAPRDFVVIDRGRRNSVVIGRMGFDELYMYSPGSSHADYGAYSFVCVGQSALLKPIVLSPGDVWRGGQDIHNPNL